MYKCHSSGSQFLGCNRINNNQLWEEYVVGKQTYSQLAFKYNCSLRTIQRRLDKHSVVLNKPIVRDVIVLMDTTYWGRAFGVMLFKDAITKENLLKYYAVHETNTLYKEGVKTLQDRGYNIVAIVCDGRKGLIRSFGNIPVQMCQFHQAAIIRRYLTKRPKLKAAQELMQVMDLMKKTDKESFVGALELWHARWNNFLNERSTNPISKKTVYTHKSLRSAYRSLNNNLHWLFTWYDCIELNIPNTTNAIDGHFADLKNKLRNHNGLSMKRKMKFIDTFFSI
ncbi:MAG: transposase [Prevotellaceae bacterium]|nr:transposase [Prevotellaceae bacterium]